MPVDSLSSSEPPFIQGELDPAVVGPVPRPAEGEKGTPAYGDADVERYVHEGRKGKTRTPFERDRARVVHSAAMRRLGAKTQVLTPGADDFSRTRLTHSLEVAQIGREMGRALGADPDLVDTACLTHDIGHPPFGHNGERALAELAADIGGFEGNAQTLRLLTRLEPKIFDAEGKSAGLNLTRASLDASVKYPWTFADRPQLPNGQRSSKFGVYDDDLPIFTWLRRGAPTGQRAIEAQIMDLADDIGYCVHDVEDAIVSGRINVKALDSADERDRVVAATRDWYGAWHEPDALHAALERLRDSGLLTREFDGTRPALAALKEGTSSLIGRFSGAAQAATRRRYGPGALTRYSAELVIPDELRYEILALKGVAVTYVMAPREAGPLYVRQRELLADLVRILADRAPTELEPAFQSDWLRASDDAARLRVVIDQVASLTDGSAQHWHDRLVTGRSSAALT